MKIGSNSEQQQQPELSLKVRCMLVGWRGKSSSSRRGQEINANGGKVRARIDVDFTVKTISGARAKNGGELGVDIEVGISTGKVYGFEDSDGARLSEVQMSGILTQMTERKSKAQNRFGDGLWKDAVKELERRVFL